MSTRALLAIPALVVGLAALVLAVLGFTFPGVIAGVVAAVMAGRAWRDREEIAVAALACGAGALAIGFLRLVQIAYAG